MNSSIDTALSCLLEDGYVVTDGQFTWSQCWYIPFRPSEFVSLSRKASVGLCHLAGGQSESSLVTKLLTVMIHQRRMFNER